MTPQQRLNLLNRFDETAQEYSWRGSKHPEDAAAIENHYHWLKRLLAKELGVALPEVVAAGEFD